jgi:hypothetical protein
MRLIVLIMSPQTSVEIPPWNKKFKVKVEAK